MNVVSRGLPVQVKSINVKEGTPNFRGGNIKWIFKEDQWIQRRFKMAKTRNDKKSIKKKDGASKNQFRDGVIIE